MYDVAGASSRGQQEFSNEAFRGDGILDSQVGGWVLASRVGGVFSRSFQGQGTLVWLGAGYFGGAFSQYATTSGWVLVCAAQARLAPN